jgi:hypothetical protein
MSRAADLTWMSLESGWEVRTAVQVRSVVQVRSERWTAARALAAALVEDEVDEGVGTLAAERMQWRRGCSGSGEGVVAPGRRGRATRAGRRGPRRDGTFSVASGKKRGGNTGEKRGGGSGS